MNRPIKFRAWNHLTKKMLPANSVRDIPNDAPTPSEHAGTTYLQFTGVTDKNGKEIYEGDILRHMPDGNVPHLPWPVVVRWDMFAWWCGNDLLRPLVDETHIVIGNVFENSDLLSTK